MVGTSSKSVPEMAIDVPMKSNELLVTSSISFPEMAIDYNRFLFIRPWILIPIAVPSPDPSFESAGLSSRAADSSGCGCDPPLAGLMS